MATIQSLQDAIAAEKEQFTTAIQAKDQVIADRDATILDLQNQLANAITPESLDPIQTGITEIVP